MAKEKLSNYSGKDYTDQELLDALIGQVTREDGYKISISKLNRYLKAFKLPTVKRDELQEEISWLSAVESGGMSLNATSNRFLLYAKVKEGEVSLEDLFGDSVQSDNFDSYLAHRIPSQVINDLGIKKNQKEFKSLLKEGAFVQDTIEQANHNLLADMHDFEFSKVKIPKIDFPTSHTSMLINAADWHIGNQFSVNEPGLHNSYDYDTFKQRWYEFLNYALKVAQQRHVKKIYLIHLGDIVEGVYMRPNQGFYTEFDFNTQIRIATKEMINSLQILSKAGYEVVTGMIIGNHDRIFTKKDNLYGDGVTQIILNSLKLVKELGQLPNVTILDNSDDIHDLNIEITGKNILFTHGEKIKKAQNNNIANLTGKRKPLDLLIYGHYHDFQVKSGNGGTMEICVPANKGWDTYSKGLATNASAAGQLLMIFELNQTPEILPYLFSD